MEKSIELGSLRLNREFVVFLILAALCAWQVVAYFVYTPPRPEIGDPYLKSSKPRGELLALAEPGDINEILSRPGSDVFVPRALLQSRKESVVPARISNNHGPRLPRPGSRSKLMQEFKNFSNSVSGRYADEVPPLPLAAARNPGPARVPIQEEYLFPLKVNGWITPAEGEPGKVMVVPAGGGDPFCLTAGEEWGDLRVKTLTPEMVEFVNQEGKIIYIDKEMLLRDKHLAETETDKQPAETTTGMVGKILKKLNLSKEGNPKAPAGKSKAAEF